MATNSITGAKKVLGAHVLEAERTKKRCGVCISGSFKSSSIHTEFGFNFSGRLV
jgi:hypothetical protein